MLSQFFDGALAYDCYSASFDSNEDCVGTAATFSTTMFVEVYAYAAFFELDVQCQTLPCDETPSPVDPVPSLLAPVAFVAGAVLGSILGFLLGDFYDDGCLFGSDDEDGLCLF